MTFTCITGCLGFKRISDLFFPLNFPSAPPPKNPIAPLQPLRFKHNHKLCHWLFLLFIRLPVLSFRLPRSPFCTEHRRSPSGHRVFLEIPALPPGTNIYSTANPGLRFGTQIKAIKALRCERTFSPPRRHAPACVHGTDKRGGADRVMGGC